MNLPWQAADVLDAILELGKRPGETIDLAQLWHKLMRGEVVSEGIKILAERGLVIERETSVELTTAGYELVRAF